MDYIKNLLALDLNALTKYVIQLLPCQMVDPITHDTTEINTHAQTQLPCVLRAKKPWLLNIYLPPEG